MSNIDEIVNVQITIESPESSGESFSALLLVLSKPANAGISMDGVIKIAKASELADYGYATTSEDYKAATIALAQDPKPEAVYVIARQTKSDDSLEDIGDTLDRALSEPGWYGLYVVSSKGSAEIGTIASWCETNRKLFGFDWTGTIGTDVMPVSNTYYRTFGMYHATDGGDYGALALMAKCFGYEPGSEQWGLKTLSSIDVATLTKSQATILDGMNSNYYRKIANSNVTMQGKVVAGEWIDTIRLRDWLVSEIQNKVFKFLKGNAKVPYNDDGITGIQGRIEEVLLQAQRNGGIDTDQTDEDGNVTAGFSVTVPKAANISAEQKATRQVKDITFTARLAGAIILAEIKGTLTY